MKVAFYLFDVIVTKLTILLFTGFFATSTQADVEILTLRKVELFNSFKTEVELN
mgnify:FL=1